MENPTELQEQSKVIKWCKERGILIGATAQNTFTNSWAAINRNKKAGVVRGLPDLIIVIPAHLRKNNLNKTVFIEMKRKKGGVISPQQKEWISALSGSEGVCAEVCAGWEEAVRLLQLLIDKNDN